MQFHYLIIDWNAIDRVAYLNCWLQVLEQRVENLERELDSAISAAARARTEKRQAEAAQKAAELRAQEITKELENTSSNFLYSLPFIWRKVFFETVVH